MRARGRTTVYFSHAMPDYIRHYTLSGLTSDADVAERLAARFDPEITEEHVKRWRREYRRFNNAVAGALSDTDARAVSVITDAIDSGDVATAKWWLERRNANFKPTAKLEHGGRIEGLDARLANRISEAELRERGIIADDASL